MDDIAGGPERLTRLEVAFEYVRRDLEEIKADQKEMRAAFEGMSGDVRATLNRLEVALAARPTTAQFWTMIATVAAIALAVIGLIVGSLQVLMGRLG